MRLRRRGAQAKAGREANAILEGCLPSAAPPAAMPTLPTGTVTFLFTDVEGSTRLWEERPDAMRLALARHDALVRADLPPAAGLQELGAHRLRDLQRPEHVYQLLHPALPADFPPLRSLNELPNNLPQQVTSFVGRERELADLKGLLAGTRLLTL